jgi:hypothetical protein
VHRIILRAVKKLQIKFWSGDPAELQKLKDSTNIVNYSQALKLTLLQEQNNHFSDVLHYFELKEKHLKDIPDLVSKLNLFIDLEGLIRVHGKFYRKQTDNTNCPILLSKNRDLTKLLIQHYHESFMHSGCYALLAELRKKFYISCIFSVVNKVLNPVYPRLF